MKCPNDNATLLMTDKQGIEIDYCPECRGVWLDRGELDKIIEKSSQTDAYAVPKTSHAPEKYNRNYEDDRKYGSPYKKKRKNILGELFDF